MSGGQLRSREFVEAILSGADSRAVWKAAVEELLTRSGENFSLAASEALGDALERQLTLAAKEERPLWQRWIDELPAIRGPVAAWLFARGTTAGANAALSVSAWNRALAMLPGVEPEGLLRRAKAHFAAGDDAAAAADVRLALAQDVAYDFRRRAEKVVGRITARSPQMARRSLRIAVLAGQAATALFIPQLRAACFRDGLRAEIWAGDYDHYRQDILAADGPLYAFAPEVILIISHWRDSRAASLSAAAGEDASAIANVQASLWRQLRSRTTAAIVAHTFDLPRHDPLGRLSSQLPGGRASVLRAANSHLRKFAAESGVVLVDLEQVAAQVGAAAWEDARLWHVAKQHPAGEGMAALADHHAAAIRALLGLSKKVLAVDLDNVLWGGIIGEDGLDRIALGPPSATGEAYAAFQHYLRELKNRGVLLAVCSKNNEADARLPFEKHPETILRLDDFVAFRANWDDKATNLRALSESLSLGLDSFVFFDDNPVERAWVRSQLPEVAVPEAPLDPSGYIGALDRGRYFEAVALSEEDLRRHELYRTQSAREELRASAGSLDDFLSDLQMTAQHGPFDAANLPRIAQLVNKTNQFNLTTRRYIEAELAAQGNDPAWWTQWFRLTDRFGAHGLVGVLTLKPRLNREGGVEPSALEIDTWLLSCRVLSRTLEAYMLRQAVEYCLTNNIVRLWGRYLPTPKNQQVADLLPRMGFQQAGEEFVLDVNAVEIRCDAIRQGSEEPGTAAED